MQKFFLLCFFFFLTITSLLFAGQHTVELKTGNDYGLVYREDDPDNMVLYGDYKQDIGTPPRRDLRIGLRNYRIYKSYFIYDLSELRDDITINSVRVLIEMEDRNYPSDKNKTLSGLNNNYDPQTMFHNFSHQYNVMELSMMDVTWSSSSDAIVSDMQAGLSDNWFGLKLEFSADPPENSIYYESKKVRVWVTYTIPDVQITINTNPTGMQYTFTGGSYDDTYTNEQVFTVEKGAQCTRSTTTPQTVNSQTYDWQNWSDGLGISASFTAQSNKSISANFNSRLLDMTITNDFGGGIVGVDGSDRNAPYPEQWLSGTTHSFNAIDQNYQAQGEANYFREFHEWEKPGENLSTNERYFSEAVLTSGTYKAKFHKWYEYDAINNFLNGGSGGDIIIDDVTETTPYSGHVVETNSITIEAPAQQQTVNGRTVYYSFLNWQDGNTQNPRTTMPNNHFNIQANYKGHLVSANSRATGYNTGRRIVQDANGDMHMVYEDNGAIWYTSSSNDGATWTNEVCISGLPGQVYQAYHSYANPSISTNMNYSPYGPAVHILYETVVDFQGATQNIITSQFKVNDGNGWTGKVYPAGNTLDVGFGTFSGAEGERPVLVSRTNNVVTAAWRNPANSKITSIRKENGSWSDPYEIAATTGYPVLVQTAAGKNEIVWAENGYLKHVESQANSV